MNKSLCVHTRDMERAGELQRIGVDPGLVHHAICKLAFWGWRYERVGEQWQKVPQFDILAWEMWDLKRKLRWALDRETWRVATSKYENTGVVAEELYRMNHNLRGIVADAAWLFARDAQGALVPLVSELQCGHIKNGEQDVYAMAHLLACEIHETDLRNGAGERLIVNGARKYGLPSDGKLSYEGRKKRAVEITRALLRQCDQRDAITFLDLLWSAQKRDRPGRTPQEHDMCDAFLLALQQCVTEWEAREKAHDNARPADAPDDDEIQIIQLWDSEEDDDLKPRKHPRKPGELGEKASKPKKTRKPKK